MRQNDTVIVGDRRISTIGNIVVRVSPAEESAAQIVEKVANIEAMDEEGFVLGIVDFEILMDAIRDLDQTTPLEIGLSRGKNAAGARLLRIRHGQTKIYIAGMTRLPPECDREPDALDAILAENEALKRRIVELESKCDPVAVFVGMGDDP